MKIKRIIFCISLMLINLLGISAFSQDNNSRMLELIEKKDLGYFDLVKQYTEEGVDLVTQMLTAINLYHYSNQPEMSANIITDLLTNHLDGDDARRADLYLLLADNLTLMQEHEAAESIVKQLAEAYVQQKGISDAGVMHFNSKHYDKLVYKDLPRSEIIRPNKDIIIPYSFDEMLKNREGKKAIVVNGYINTQNTDMIYDTGATITLVSEEFSRNSNIKIISDSILIQGINASTQCKLGLIDSLRIGDILYLNTPCGIRGSDSPLNTLAVNIILGNNLMDAMNETQIYPKEQKIVYPIEQSDMPEHGINLLFRNRIPSVSTFSNDERIIFFADTGDLGSSLASYYFDKHRETIEKLGVKDSIEVGDIAGIRKLEVYKLPEIPIQIGNTNRVFKNIEVNTIPDCDCGNEHLESGRMGMEMLKGYDKITINYRKAFMTVE